MDDTPRSLHYGYGNGGRAGYAPTRTAMMGDVELRGEGVDLNSTLFPDDSALSTSSFYSEGPTQHHHRWGMLSDVPTEALFSPEELVSALGMDPLLRDDGDGEGRWAPYRQPATSRYANPNPFMTEQFQFQPEVGSQRQDQGNTKPPNVYSSPSRGSQLMGEVHDECGDDKVASRATKGGKAKRKDDTERADSGSSALAIADTWVERYNELKEFKAQHGHCCVPNSYEANIVLGRWVKRQRYQYKLQQDGKRSSLTNERKVMLESLGFIWDSHDATWEERLRELYTFRDLHGHCKVPSSYPPNQELAIWAKRQRRLFKIYCTKVADNSNGRAAAGASSTPASRTSNAMTLQRIFKLANAGFIFNNLDSHGALESLDKIARARDTSTKATTQEHRNNNQKRHQQHREV